MGLTRILGSVKFTLVLLILLVLASILGTLIPQNWTDLQYKGKFGDAGYSLLKNLQLRDVYHSYWYTALLAIFCINLSVCSIQTLGPLVRSLRRSGSTAGRVKLNDLPFYRDISLRSAANHIDSGRVIQEIKDVLGRSFYRLKYSDADGGIYYFERGKLGRLGPVITHASIIIILIGGIIVGRLGFDDYLGIPVGKTVDVPKSDFQIRVDDFKVEFYPDSNMPKEYTSVLTIVESGVPQLTKAIEVNRPLKYRAVKFYQSSYGMSDNVEIEVSEKVGSKDTASEGKPPEDKSDASVSGKVLGRFKIDVGQEFQIPDSDLKIKALSLVPDFVRDSSGRVGTRSKDPKNPALLYELYEGDEVKDRAWAFLKHPGFHASGKSNYSVKFASIVYYTGLQVSSDPGLAVIWIGCLLMVAGMFLSFYLSYKRIWVNISADRVEMGARSYKDRSGFQKEFHRLRALFDK